MAALDLLSAGSAVLNPASLIGGGLSASSSAKSAAEGYNSQTVTATSGDFSVNSGGNSGNLIYWALGGAVLIGIVWLKKR